MVVIKAKWERVGSLVISKIVSCATASKQAIITSLAFKTKQTTQWHWVELEASQTLEIHGWNCYPECPYSKTKQHYSIISSWHYKYLAAAAAKSLQSCPTLCDPIDSSPRGSPVPGILQARILEWVATSLSNAWKWKVKVKMLSRIRLLATPWTEAYQAPPSMGFSRQEYWSGLPLPSPKSILHYQKSQSYRNCVCIQ